MSYLNQKESFKRILLSTAVIGSVVCSSAAVFAMDTDEWETPISQKRIKSDQAIVNVIYKSNYTKVYNGILFEWSENQEKQAALVHYEADESIFATVCTVAVDEAPECLDAVGEATYIKMFKKLRPIASRVWAKDYSVEGIAHCVLGAPNVEGYIEKQNWQIVGSWVKSVEDVKKGIHKAAQIIQDPPRYSLHAHLPRVDVDSEVHNSLTISAALLYSSGIKDYHNVFIASPRVWNPQPR